MGQPSKNRGAVSKADSKSARHEDHEDQGFFPMIKNIIYRFCFFMGLATTAYHSYAEISAWVNPASATPETEGSLLHDKVSQLAQDQKGGALAEFPAAIPISGLRVRRRHAFHDINALPKPENAPIASETPKPAEVVKTEEEKAAELAAAASPTPTDGAEEASSVANPIYYPEAMQVPNPDSNTTTQAAAMTPDKDMPLGNGPPLNRQPTGNPYNSTNTTSFDSSSTVATGGTFSISDFRTMTASFPPAGSASTPYSGQRCVFPGACSPDSSISIFPLRWSVTQGLASAASFSVTASPSGTYPIHVAVQFSIQSSSAAVADSFTPQITSFPAPTVSGGIKTYTIHFANLTVSSGDALSNLQASISVKPDGTLVNSYFKFTKDLPQTLSTDWNPLSPDASLTTGQTYFNVPGVTYTMNLSR